MRKRLLFFTITILTLLFFNGCNSSEKKDGFRLNYEGKDFVCQVIKEENEHRLLKCYSEDQYQLYIEYLGNWKEGLLRILYPSDSLFIEGTFVNNKQEGIWKEYYESGELKSFSYVVQDIEFYSKSYEVSEGRFIGHLPVEMKKYNYNDSTDLEFILAYSSLDTFYTGGVFEYQLNEEERVIYRSTSRTNQLKLRIPKTFQGEINIDFLELDTSYSYMAGEKLIVKVDSLHNNIKLFDNILSNQEYLNIFKSHKKKMKKRLPRLSKI